MPQFFKTLLVGLFSTFIISAHPQSLKAQQALSNHNIAIHFQEEIAAQCYKKNNMVIKFKNLKVLCVWGIIKKSNSPNEERRFYSIAYLNSPGGDIRQAWRIGEEVYKNKAIGIIDRHCHSSCGTYLVPSLKRVFVREQTVMSMHTSLPRTPLEYILVKDTEFLRNISSEDPDRFTSKGMIEKIREFDLFHSTFVLGELEYFRKINTDPAYTFRFREVYRTLKNRERYNCGPMGGLYLILGPKYLAEFKVKVSEGWFPTGKDQYAALMKNVAPTDTLIFDFDEHPFWVPSYGLVSESDCRN